MLIDLRPSHGSMVSGPWRPWPWLVLGAMVVAVHAAALAHAVAVLFHARSFDAHARVCLAKDHELGWVMGASFMLFLLTGGATMLAAHRRETGQFLPGGSNRGNPEARFTTMERTGFGVLVATMIVTVLLGMYASWRSDFLSAQREGERFVLAHKDRASVEITQGEFVEHSTRTARAAGIFFVGFPMAATLLTLNLMKQPSRESSGDAV